MKRKHRRAATPKGAIPLPSGGYATEHVHVHAKGRLYTRAEHRQPVDMTKLAQAFMLYEHAKRNGRLRKPKP